VFQTVDSWCRLALMLPGSNSSTNQTFLCGPTDRVVAVSGCRSGTQLPAPAGPQGAYTHNSFLGRKEVQTCDFSTGRKANMTGSQADSSAATEHKPQIGGQFIRKAPMPSCTPKSNNCWVQLLRELSLYVGMGIKM